MLNTNQDWTNKPKNRKYKLSDGTLVFVKFKRDTIDAKVKALGSYVRLPNKKVMTVPIAVQSTVVEIQVSGGLPISARSCCKPPDKFCEKLGIHTATKRLLKKVTLIDLAQPGTVTLPKAIRTELMQTVCSFLTPYQQQ